MGVRSIKNTGKHIVYILDACCGGRMCWFDKNNLHTLYVDCRRAAPGHVPLRPKHTVQPDELVDFRSMPYSDKAFKLILFDPPHMLKRNGKEGLMAAKYGCLGEHWEDDIRQGFEECWRVLDDFGTLIFKWSSSEVPLKKVLSLFSHEPLFGHTTTRSGTTHWMTFFKLKEAGEYEA